MVPPSNLGSYAMYSTVSSSYFVHPVEKGTKFIKVSPFWDLTLRRSVSGQSIHCLNLKDATDILSRNVGNYESVGLTSQKNEDLIYNAFTRTSFQITPRK